MHQSSHTLQNLEHRCILDIFASFALSIPSHPALVWNNNIISYKELDRRSNVVANILTRRGIKRGERIVVMLDRGIDLIISMLAILKCGGIYVPVDPHYPEERRNFILHDVAPVFTIHDIPGQFGTLEQLEEFTYQQLQDTDPAYIIYTSGTTGKPKGAINTHQGLLNLAREQIVGFCVTQESRVLQFASPSFDASISEIVMALCSGATLVLGNQEEMVPGPSLAKLLQTQRVTHLTLPPSVLAALQSSVFPDLKVLIVAGEACPVELLRRWITGRRIFNGYGVSEAAVCSSIREFDPGLATLPIGKAMGGVTYYVLDALQKPVPPGEVGELYIGGVGVGLGYVNRPELTNERFITLSQAPGKPRVYRTGDLVRKLLDQSLEYIGRIDNQVKIRGFRIELDEIVNQLLAHPGVEQSAVVVRVDSHGNKQLAAFYTVREEIDVTRASLRIFLAAKLPGYMIPSFFVKLVTFPLAPTGKINLKALQEWRFEEGAIHPDDAPSTKTEHTLVSLCQDVLDMHSIGIAQSFLDLGGDSLRAAQLAWRIEEEFSVPITEPEILRAEDLRSLAAAIDAKGVGTTIKLLQQPRTGPVQPGPNHEIFGVLEQFGVDTSPLNCCAAFSIIGEIDVESLSRAYKKLFARHESLRVHFPRVNGKFLIDVLRSAEPNLEFIDYSQEKDPKGKVEEFYRYAERIQFSIRDALLARTFLLKLSSSESILVLIAHHAIFDAWSVRIFLQDLFSLVAEQKTGKKFLEPLKVQYLDFLDWQHRMLRTRDERSIDEYMREVFKRPLQYFDLKPIMARPPYKSMKGGNCFTSFGRTLTERLTNFCSRKQLTPFMVCTAALKTALYKHSEQPDITIGGPVSIRYHRDLERQIGLYGAMYILRTTFRGADTFKDYLGQVRERLLTAYRSQIYTIGALLEKYELGQDLSRTAPYDVSSASLMFPLPLCLPEVQRLLNIEIKPLRYPLTTAFFDLEYTFHLFNGEIELETRYDGALYTGAQVAQLAADCLQILEHVLDAPETPIRKLL